MLLGKHLLSTVWLYSKDVAATKRFYVDVLGLPTFDEHGGTAHFDGGGVRLSLHPLEESRKGADGFLVFLVEEGIETVCQELAGRGVVFTQELHEAEFGKVASFRDPDGHSLHVWQPPPPDDPRYPTVASLVRHYESVSRRLSAER